MRALTVMQPDTEVVEPRRQETGVGHVGARKYS